MRVSGANNKQLDFQVVSILFLLLRYHNQEVWIPSGSFSHCSKVFVGMQKCFFNDPIDTCYLLVEIKLQLKLRIRCLTWIKNPRGVFRNHCRSGTILQFWVRLIHASCCLAMLAGLCQLFNLLFDPDFGKSAELKDKMF